MIATMACGVKVSVAPESNQPPVCPECGEHRVRHMAAPAPRFRGMVRGPSAVTESLVAIPVAVAPSGPLTLKES